MSIIIRPRLLLFRLWQANFEHKLLSFFNFVFYRSNVFGRSVNNNNCCFLFLDDWGILFVTRNLLLRAKLAIVKSQQILVVHLFLRVVNALTVPFGPHDIVKLTLVLSKSILPTTPMPGPELFEFPLKYPNAIRGTQHWVGCACFL